MKKELKVAAYMRVGNPEQLNCENNLRRCAIYNRYSVENPEFLEGQRIKLLAYCKDNLGISDYELFAEVGSCLEKREVFDEMIARIQKKDFTDLLVYHMDRLYKPMYDRKMLPKILKDFEGKVVIHTMK